MHTNWTNGNFRANILKKAPNAHRTNVKLLNFDLHRFINTVALELINIGVAMERLRF